MLINRRAIHFLLVVIGAFCLGLASSAATQRRYPRRVLRYGDPAAKRCLENCHGINSCPSECINAAIVYTPEEIKAIRSKAAKAAAQASSEPGTLPPGVSPGPGASDSGFSSTSGNSGVPANGKCACQQYDYACAGDDGACGKDGYMNWVQLFGGAQYRGYPFKVTTAGNVSALACKGVKSLPPECKGSVPECKDPDTRKDLFEHVGGNEPAYISLLCAGDSSGSDSSKTGLGSATGSSQGTGTNSAGTSGEAGVPSGGNTSAVSGVTGSGAGGNNGGNASQASFSNNCYHCLQQCITDYQGNLDPSDPHASDPHVVIGHCPLDFPTCHSGDACGRASSLGCVLKVDKALPPPGFQPMVPPISVKIGDREATATLYCPNPTSTKN